VLESPFGDRVEKVYDLDDDRDLSSVGLSKNEERADRIIHFVECHHAVIEKKGRAQKLSKAISQIHNTVERTTIKNIKFAIVVKEKIPRAEQGFYHWDHVTMRVTYSRSPERPVMVANGLPLYMLTPGQARGYGLV
jgi:hypothetical protein